MTNPNYNSAANKRPPSKSGKGAPLPAEGRSPAGAPMPEKSPNWPGLPGKSGPDRSAGVKRAKVYPKSQGI